MSTQKQQLVKKISLKCLKCCEINCWHDSMRCSSDLLLREIGQNWSKLQITNKHK